MSEFVRRWGWRAYALPILVMITVVALLQPPHESGHSRPAAAAVVEGSAAGHGFAAGSTPAPVVIKLKTDTITSCAGSPFAKLLLVSISQQHLWACQGGRQVNSVPVTTGSVVDHDQTPVGSWRVQAKQRDRYLVGPGYRDYVRYWVPFNGDYGFHDAPWQTMPFGSKDWPQHGSHGCVHLPTPAMAWLFGWVGVGSTVVTVHR